jgi:hypothetical protein
MKGEIVPLRSSLMMSHNLRAREIGYALIRLDTLSHAARV